VVAAAVTKASARRPELQSARPRVCCVPTAGRQRTRNNVKIKHTTYESLLCCDLLLRRGGVEGGGAGGAGAVGGGEVEGVPSPNSALVVTARCAQCVRSAVLCYINIT